MPKDEKVLDRICDSVVVEEPMTGQTIRAYREKLHLSREDFLDELRKYEREEHEFKFSSGHLQRVELGQNKITDRLIKAVQTHKKNRK